MLQRIKYLNVFIKDPDKKRPLTIFKEIIQYSWVKRVIPTDYFRKYLYRTDIKNITNYLSYKQYYSILLSKKLVFPEVSALLHNKLSFHLLCEKHQINTPKLYCYNIKSQFYYNNSFVSVENTNELVKFFLKIYQDNNIESLFLKPIDGIGGQGCFLLHKDNLKEQLIEKQQLLLNQSYLHEAYIIQHPEINHIHSNCVNTLRIVTYIDYNNKVHVVSVFMRFGIGKSITDNTHTGGFYIGVDTMTGKLSGVGRQDVNMGGKVFTKHPASNEVLEGFKVPFFKEACLLVQEANLIFPNRIVGWDVAITKTGPVIIEANHNPSLHVSDVAYGGYCNHPIIKEILQEIN
ncbi:sugar-transfer associated ATP-grasp domain-containing protein [Mariniflexile sp.]|uniref:sugar-transfer associated ATP-grasp domain-containing protein n=1 Tax=Mariniflexile sp. TaxID=1979402 RepID=UPI0035620876